MTLTPEVFRRFAGFLLVPLIAMLALAGCSTSGSIDNGETGGRTAIPPPAGFVVDESGALPAPIRSQIEAELADYERRTSNEIAVLLVPTTRDQSIDDYSNDVVRSWGVGKEGRDNGVLVVLALDDRRGRIEVGFGLEGTLTDVEANDVLQRQAFPRLRENDVAGAVTATTRELRSQLADPLAGVSAPPAATAPATRPSGGSGSLLSLLLFGGPLFLLFGLLGSGRRRSSWYGSGSGWHGGGFGGGFGGGGFGGGGGGGGGFGGFGGGGSGGGGASGDW